MKINNIDLTNGLGLYPVVPLFQHFQTLQKCFLKIVFGINFCESLFLHYKGTTIQPTYNNMYLKRIEAIFEVVPFAV